MTDTEAMRQPEKTDTTSWKEAPFLLIKGFLMGSADIVPGVSGGTMALILGIYSRLIHAIRSADATFVRRLSSLRLREAFETLHWRFLVVLLSGILLAILFFTRVVPLQVYMFTNPELIFGIFFGLIVGSIYVLIKAIESIDWKHILSILAGTLIGYWVVTLVPTDTPETHFFVFLSGSIAICAMILPGISGSYLLLILRKYDYILSQVAAIGNDIEPLLVLSVFLLGAVVGLVLFSRLLSWLLDRYYGLTLAVLIGFLIGSLYVIWPYQDRTYRPIVRETEWIDYGDPLAVDLRSRSREPELPSYRRLGSVTGSGEDRKVELQRVSLKLVRTEPFVPFVTRADAGTSHFWPGVLGIVTGILLVGGLDYLRRE